MIITVPFIYLAEVKRTRKRNREEGYFRGSVAVKVPEVTGTEAPVAFMHADAADDFPTVARWHRETLWVPSGEDGHADAAELARMLSDPREAALGLHWGKPRPGELSDVAAEADPSVVEVYGSDLDEVVAKVRRQVADLVVIDGMAWQSSPEPMIKVDWSGDRVWASVKAMSTLGHQTFRLDEVDAIPACLPQRDAAEVAAAVQALGIKVEMPQALRLDTATPALLRAADSAVDRMRENVAKADVAHFVTFAALRDAHDAAMTAKGERLAPSVAALADAMRNALSGYGGEGPWALSPGLAYRIEGALARPDARRHAVDDLAGFTP